MFSDDSNLPCNCNKLSPECIDFLPDDSEGFSKVKPLPYGAYKYHLRFSLFDDCELEKDELDEFYKIQSKKIINKFVNKWKPITFLAGFEYSDKNVAHCHVTLTYDKVIPKSTMSDYMKEFKPFFTKTTPYYHKQLDKDILQSEMYCIKDECIIGTNYPDSLIQEIKDRVKDIKADMKISPRTKCLNHINEWSKDIDREIRFGEIKFQLVCLYVNEYDKAPPPNIKQLALYCAFKLNLCNDLDLESII